MGVPSCFDQVSGIESTASCGLSSEYVTDSPIQKKHTSSQTNTSKSELICTKKLKTISTLNPLSSVFCQSVLKNKRKKSRPAAGWPGKSG
jgi:hypothetical protein